MFLSPPAKEEGKKGGNKQISCHNIVERQEEWISTSRAHDTKHSSRSRTRRGGGGGGHEEKPCWIKGIEYKITHEIMHACCIRALFHLPWHWWDRFRTQQGRGRGGGRLAGAARQSVSGTSVRQAEKRSSTPQFDYSVIQHYHSNTALLYKLYRPTRSVAVQQYSSFRRRCRPTVVLFHSSTRKSILPSIELS